jgi:spore maturation protein CgeB
MLLLVGNDTEWAIEPIFAKYLNRLGLRTEIFSISNLYKELSLLDKIKIRINDFSVYKELNSSLYEFCLKVKPKCLWVFKGVEIFPETLYSIRKLGILIVNFNPDHPFERNYLSSGSSLILDSIKLYDLHFTYNLKIKDRLWRDYSISAKWLPFGYDHIYDFNFFGNSYSEIEKICFIGNADKDRVKTIRFLLKNNFEIDVYGNYWEKIERHKNLRKFEPVYGEEFYKLIRLYKIQLNILRTQNYDSHNMRTFEIPSIGGVQLTQHSQEQLMFYKDGEEIFTYNDEPTLIKKINYLFDISKNEVDELRLLAYKRTMNSNYSYLDRAQLVKSAISELV